MKGLLVVLLCVASATCYRILGFHPIPGKSQHNIFAPVLLGLARKNHSVVYLTPVPPETSHPNLEVRLIPRYQKEFLDAIGLADMSGVSHPMMSHRLYVGAETVADFMYGDKLTQALIHSDEHYDAVMLETSIAQEPASALIHKFSCPGIEISTLGNMAWVNELSGLPSDPAFIPDCKSEFTDKMDFWERLYNAYITWSTVLVGYYHLNFHMQGLMDEYFNYTGWETRPPLAQLVSNRSLVLINQVTALDSPVPLAPHMKQIGGVNIAPSKPLPGPIQKWMDGAENGVIYFSLGSNLNTSEIMTDIIGKSFISVFKELPQRVIMKWEANERPKGMPKNMFFYKWVPQQDVLAHKNCRVFVSHGGLLSLTEATYNAVPILGIPFFWDQQKNMMQVHTAGFGLKLDLTNITVENVRWSFNELLNNPRYKKEALRRQSLIKDSRHSAVDEAVYWIEHTIKYPNHLTPRSVHLSFVAMHNLDIYAFVLSVVVVICLVIKVIFRFIASMVYPSSSKKKID